MKEKICGIYKIENKINGKVYIGQSVDIYRRWKCHKTTVVNSDCREYEYPLYRAIRKYGIDNFDFSILTVCDKEVINELERDYVKQYNAYIRWENSNGYNQQIGGGNKITFSQNQNKQNQKQTIRNKMKKIYCEGIEFKNLSHCSDYYGIPRTTMSEWINRKHAMPRYWYDLNLHREDLDMSDYECLDDVKAERKLIRKNNKKESKFRDVVCDRMIFKSAKECAEYYGEDCIEFREWLNGKTPMPDKYIKLGLRRLF